MQSALYSPPARAAGGVPPVHREFTLHSPGWASAATVRCFNLAVTTCAREGCARPKKSDGYCCLLCIEIDRKLTRTRDLIAERGISPTAAALWAAAVSLSDQLSEVNRLERIVKSAKPAAEPSLV